MFITYCGNHMHFDQKKNFKNINSHFFSFCNKYFMGGEGEGLI